MSEVRRPSIFDTPTPLQIEAWEWCHSGLVSYGKELYQKDMHNKIIELFKRGDEGNAKLDAISAVKPLIKKQLQKV